MFGQEDYLSFETSTKIHARGYRSHYITVTLYEAQMWIWQQHHIFVTAFVTPGFLPTYKFKYCIQRGKKIIISFEYFETIQKALSAGIDEALKLI